MTDVTTRFPAAVPLEDISTSTVAEALLEIFRRVGLPFRPWISIHIRNYARSVQISKRETIITAGNGVIENFSKTVKNLLKKTTAEKPKNWYRYLGPLTVAVRDTPQDRVHTV